jgi:hypothetical protein
MQDPDIERLLRRYRPLPPSEQLFGKITKAPHHPITRSPKTWPWAVAAAALLTITLGLHGAIAPAPDTAPVVDTKRVDAIVEELGQAPGSDVVAEWIARRELRAEQDARAARAAVEIVRQ